MGAVNCGIRCAKSGSRLKEFARHGSDRFEKAPTEISGLFIFANPEMRLAPATSCLEGSLLGVVPNPLGDSFDPLGRLSRVLSTGRPGRRTGYLGAEVYDAVFRQVTNLYPWYDPSHAP